MRLNWNSNKKAKNLQMRAVTFRIRFSMGPMSLGPILNLNTIEFQRLSALAHDRKFKSIGPMELGPILKHDEKVDLTLQSYQKSLCR